MTDYLDTSVVVASLLPEAHSERVRAWLADRPDDPLVVSFWSVTEVASALAKRIRMRTLSVTERDRVLGAWNAMRTTSLVTLTAEAQHFVAAATYSGQHELGLRAADALHLAIAAAGGHRVVTLDATMAAAAPALGVRVLVP